MSAAFLFKDWLVDVGSVKHVWRYSPLTSHHGHSVTFALTRCVPLFFFVNWDVASMTPTTNTTMTVANQSL